MNDATNQNKANRSVFLPILLPTLAILLFAGTQLRSTLIVSSKMQAQQASQSTPYEQALKVRQQLRDLATELQQLAANGNSNAAKIVEKLEQRGVSVTPLTSNPQ